MLGVGLLGAHLLLSFTGYLLPWDQLAFWAITVGTSIAASVPLVGEQMRQFLLGGTLIGQPTLIRFYVLHCALLPLVLFGRGLAHVARAQGRRAGHRRAAAGRQALSATAGSARKSKTYSILGIASGTSVQVSDPTTLDEDNSCPPRPT